ncbi:eukaryotic translation initiation factor eIF2A-domain-containing protein [Cyathus striatus]|nr:eukaryotic translation initiation factor eIF2A-domain-containing protein [Cyathus striatus]
MSSQISQQYAYRAQKTLGLVGGSPDYIPIQGFEAPDVPARTYVYSADGRFFAYALPNVVRIYQAEGAQLLQELPLANIVEIGFSPRGTYLSTWERPVKKDDGTQHKNHRIFSASTGNELISFTQKSQTDFDVQYTFSESHAIRLVNSEIQVYRPAEWEKGVVDKLKVEGASMVRLSPGLNPSVAVFVGEKKGAPASIKIHPLISLSSPPTCQKNFYKADRATIKWNTLGTQVLLLTHTEVDNSNKSYYGETGLYLLSAAGNFDCRVVLDKEGPIHDFAWSPGSKEFGVVYGLVDLHSPKQPGDEGKERLFSLQFSSSEFPRWDERRGLGTVLSISSRLSKWVDEATPPYMPAKTTLFDQRVRTLHDFGSAPHNFIAFNPQGRLIALAGFGNLAGKMDVFDRKTLTKVTTIDAPNTSHCEWSPCGRFLLTATLSPRLRVDNGIKIWHCTGSLQHVQAIEELYQASWRPTPIDSAPPFGQGLPQAPAPAESVKEQVEKPQAVKAAGAYRPPGARGLATPAIFKREDEGGVSRVPTPGGGGVQRGYNRSPGSVPGAPGYGQNGKKVVPGAAQQQGQGQGQGQGGQGGQQGEGKKRKGKGKKELDALQVNGGTQSPRRNGKGGGGSAVQSGAATPVVVEEEKVPVTPATPATPGVDGALDALAKKMRNLNKKLKAIDELKEKARRGERLEATQLKKMEGEEEIKKELASLGWAP